LDWPFAIVRLVTALIVAMVTALVVAAVRRSGGDSMAPVDPSAQFAAPDAAGNPLRRLLLYFDDLLYHVGPWTLLGLLVAGFVQASMPAQALQGFGTFGLDVFVVSVVAVPSYVCAASATPLAAVLLAKGLSPGAILAGLLLGPATNLATAGWLRQNFGTKAALWGIGALVVVTWALALGLNAAPISITPLVGKAFAHEHSWVTRSSAIVLGLLVLRGIWKHGLRGWLGSLRESLTSDSEEHSHPEHDRS